MTAWGAGCLLPGPGARASDSSGVRLSPPRTAIAFPRFPAGSALWWPSCLSPRWRGGGSRSSASNDRDWLPERRRRRGPTWAGDLSPSTTSATSSTARRRIYVAALGDPTYDLAKLDSVDLISGTGAARRHRPYHGELRLRRRLHRVMSIEARKERGEGYSTLGGFFKQYELVYIAGDERDLIGVRTTYRESAGGRVRLPGERPPENARRVFVDYLRSMNEMCASVPCLLQHADDQLHHHGLPAHADEPRPPPVLLEDAGERLRPAASLRARTHRHQDPLRRARADIAGQRQGPCRRRRSGLLPPASGRGLAIPPPLPERRASSTTN